MPRQSKDEKSLLKVVVLQNELDKRRAVLSPVSKLRVPERAIFDLIATNNLHLSKLDVPLIEAFAIASARVSAKGRTLKIAELDKNVRMLMMLATKLRITPQSRIDPEKLSRHLKNTVKNKGTWENDDAEESDDEEAEGEDAEG